MSIDCWIISLNPEALEVKSFQAQLVGLGLRTYIFPAVDGRSGLPSLQAGEQIDQAAALRFRCAPLGNAEIGCYLSHYRLIRQLYDSGAQAACILEDDVVLERGFRQALDAIVTLDESHELIRLMGLRLHPRKVCRVLDNSLRLVRPSKGWVGTQGYVINRAGMKKVLEHGSVLSKPIDKLFDYFWENDLHCFAVEPHVIHERSTASSIPKQKDKEPGLKVWFVWSLHKLLSSVRRKIYLLRHWNDFFPAARPSADIGRTTRIK